MGSNSSNLRVWRIFVASPSDVQEEREKLREVVEKFIQPVAHRRGVHIELKDWMEVTPLLGCPLEVILDELKLEEIDHLIMILWKRLGTPSGRADPQTGEAYLGTEEEFKRAYELWKEHGRPQISVYRCKREIDPDADAEQLKRLQDFLDDLKAGGHHPGLYREYNSVDEFRKFVFGDLERLMSKISPPQPATLPSSPSPGSATAADPTTATLDDVDTDSLEAYLEECGKEVKDLDLCN